MDSSDISDAGSKPLHQALPNITAPRSRTDPPALESHQQQKSQLHRRLGSSGLRNKTFHASGSNHGDHHHQHQSRRQHAKEAVQSAIELKPPISFEHLLRRDKKTPGSGRHGNITPKSQGQNQRDVFESSQQQQREEAEQRMISAEQVARAKQQNVKRESELRTSLRAVEDTAMNSTRRLDDTYYAILEKASFLRSTLAGLQQLADESRQMHQSFQDDASKMEDEIQTKLDSFANFNPQETAVDQLVSKLSQAKERTNRLNQRLEDAWTRVEAYEEREKAKGMQARKRWGWSSFVAFVILASFMAVLTSKHRTAVTSGLHDAVRQIDELGGEMLHPVAALLKPIMHREEDPYLQKLFDEL